MKCLFLQCESSQLDSEFYYELSKLMPGETMLMRLTSMVRLENLLTLN